MKQEDYNEIVEKLDAVFEVFERVAISDAQEAMTTFIRMHYFDFWRVMKSPNEL